MNDESKQAMRRFNFWIPKELIEEVTKKVKDTGNSVSSWMRIAIEEKLLREPDKNQG